jgi:hypothetical protein
MRTKVLSMAAGLDLVGSLVVTGCSPASPSESGISGRVVAFAALGGVGRAYDGREVHAGQRASRGACRCAIIVRNACEGILLLPLLSRLNGSPGRRDFR